MKLFYKPAPSSVGRSAGLSVIKAREVSLLMLLLELLVVVILTGVCTAGSPSWRSRARWPASGPSSPGRSTQPDLAAPGQRWQRLSSQATTITTPAMLATATRSTATERLNQTGILFETFICPFFKITVNTDGKFYWRVKKIDS